MNVLAGSRALEEPLVVYSAGAEVGPILDDRTALARRTVRRTHEARTGKGRRLFHLMKTATFTVPLAIWGRGRRFADGRVWPLQASSSECRGASSTALPSTSDRLEGRV